MSEAVWMSLAFHDSAERKGRIWCPSTSQYAGYSFTHPHSLVRLGRSGTFIMRFTDAWEFRLFHKSKPPLTVGAADFANAVRNDTAEALSVYNKNAPYLEVIEPAPLEVEDRGVIDDLLND